MQITDCDSEKRLHLKFVKLGSDRRRLTNELLALLPEIYERKIYKKYTATIIEYAGKFGGLSKGVVLKRLRLEKYLQDKPLLKESIRTEGVHKVALVATLATPETERAWVSKIENMSKLALQELSKEVRNRREGLGSKSEAGLNKNLGTGPTYAGFCANSSAPCKAVPVKITLELDEEMSFLFLSLKKKFGGNLGNREVMKKILEMATHERSPAISGASECASFSRPRQGRSERKVNCAPLFEGDVHIPNIAKPAKVTPGDNSALSHGRYIPIQLKRAALSNSNNHCSYPNCNRPPEIFHHAERFALNQSHKSIAPICKIHHEFAHNGLILNEKQRSQNWRMRFGNGPPDWCPQDQIDRLYIWRRGMAVAEMKK